MLSVPGTWIWDFWLADDGERFHIFFLNASTSLGDPRRRHRAARIGHASSPDLHTWTEHRAPFDAGGLDSFDETATWTGCVVRGHDGLWRMFYTGSRFLAEEPDVAHIEAVGLAVSADLEHWEKRPGPVTRADPRWYETGDLSRTNEETWRDPWVFPDPSGEGWHMLVTARAKEGAADDRGVVGHAFSADLENWEVLPPLSLPGSGFSHLEVPQVARIDGHWMLLFSCPAAALSSEHAARHSDVGSWALPITTPIGPLDVAKARPITTSRLYSARFVQARDGGWALMGFVNRPDDEPFPGVVSDPLRIVLDDAGYPLPEVATGAPW